MKFKFIVASIFCCSLFLTSCAEKATKQIHQVNCRYWLQKCHQKARTRCRTGYSVVRSVRMNKVGGPQGAYKEFKMLFTCN